MNTEMLDRIMTARAYQKKAIQALFPEEMNSHLEVIERELKLMAGEVLQSLWWDICTHSSTEQKYYGTEMYTTDRAESDRNMRGSSAAENKEHQNAKNTAENGKSRQAHDTHKIEIV